MKHNAMISLRASQSRSSKAVLILVAKLHSKNLTARSSTRKGKGKGEADKGTRDKEVRYSTVKVTM